MDLANNLTLENTWFVVGPALVFFSALFIGLAARKIVFIRLAKWASGTQTEIDDIIIHAISRPSVIWCLMLSLYIALDASKMPQEFVGMAGKILLALGIISVTIALSNIAGGMVRVYSGELNSELGSASLTQNIIRIAIFSIGILVLLNSLGISIAPILATLGVGGLAVALALQETLSNLFAGFNITLAKNIHIGDYIKLDNGQEGYVTDIDWRNTRIRMLPNNIVLIPNSKLAQSVITNYHLPDKELAVLVEVGVHYDSDLEKVEKVTCEVAKDIMKSVSGGVGGFEPLVRYHTFGDFSIGLTVVMRGKEFTDQYLIKHEFIKRLHKRYAKEGIVIPYPVRAINYAQEKAVQ